jgi:phosphoribosylformylglycinamidine (FGAM) synthase-like enzyme
VFWTFYESVRGLSDACKAFGVPVISGNVSFYNESFGQAIYPTPTVGLVGLMDDVHARATVGFEDDGDVIVLVGESLEELGGSEYLKVEHGLVSGRPPALDLELERDVQAAVRDAIRGFLVKSAHDCSEGGIAVTLAESCLAGQIGADVHLEDGLAPAASLFGETQSRIVVTVSEADAEKLVEHLIERNVPYGVIGTVGGERLTICEKLDLSLDDLAEAFEPTLAELVAGVVQTEELHEG